MTSSVVTRKCLTGAALSLCVSLAPVVAQVQAPATKPKPAVPAAQPVKQTVPKPKPFLAVDNNAPFELPKIVLPFDTATGAGFDWDKLTKLGYYQALSSPQQPVIAGVTYLQEAIKRMTGKELAVVASTDLSRGIVLTTLVHAPAALRNDPAVVAALRNTGEDSYNNNEAYYVRSEPNRVLIIANTVDGLRHGVVELLESVGYEALAMGPNWTHVPDFKTTPLTFTIDRAGRPGFYIRSLWPTSGQGYGVGTIHQQTLADPADENVEVSLKRWQTGARIAGQSMPGFPGHALQAYHRAVVKKMLERKSTAGFLLKKTTLGLAAERPAPTTENTGELWINTDAEGQPGATKLYISDGKNWDEQNLISLGAAMDVSVPVVRETIFDALKKNAEAHFKANPGELLVFGTDPEDGGGGYVYLNDKNWYTDYLKKEGVAFGNPYVLHKFKGLDQPNELWDPAAPTDVVFGFNNWLLREYDKWIDSLPADQQVSNGKSKKELVRASLYCYNYHDVPPNFNLDPRIRVMIAGYPKHRGWGKWKNFASQTDMAQAYQKMLPREPSGDYWIISLSYYWDSGTHGIGGSDSAAKIQKSIQKEYESGFKALSVETDFNFGKRGLAYYLYSKALWNPTLSAAQLEGIRDRWLQRAFGSGWAEMKAYYDFMTPEGFQINAPNNWAKAIRLIDAAGKKIEAANEPEALKRLDDIKQFWYFYYLLETGKGKPDAHEMKEFAWKGQMSYVTAMHMVTRTIFKLNSPKEAAGPEFNTGPAHYTHEETQAWWTKMLETWPVTPVSNFTDATLANGKKGKDVDLNDLVAVQEFQAGAGTTLPADVSFLYNAGYMKPANFVTVATKQGEEIGFKMYWPWNPKDNYYRDRDVAYGISRWNPTTKKWDELVDKNMTAKHSETTKMKDGGEYQLAEVRYAAPQAGAYRFDLGLGGNLSRLTTLGFDHTTGTYTGPRPQTYFGNIDGLTQSGVYVYIPKGTKSFDLEVWDTYKIKRLTLHTGLPSTGLTKTRVVDVGKRGTHTVALNAGEDGSIAHLHGDGFAFPYLYSLPTYWAKSPASLVVPRGIAVADGLTVTK